jgi:hypothetical protein
VVNQVVVPEDLARPAREALTRMLEISRQAESAARPLAAPGKVR